MTVEHRNITIGTAGHIDHGKTALVKFLTGCDTDRLKEEKERGMSIELGFAPCQIANLEVGIVDVPGHEGFIRTMVAGATGMDGVILVVAADDGVMPQTREHMDILTLLGIHHGIVALTKIDRVRVEEHGGVIEKVRAFLHGTFLQDAPVLPVSNITGEGFDDFYRGLATLVASIRPKSTAGVFRMPVERAFSLHGVGTVVSGIPVTGEARIGHTLVLLPQGVEGVVRAIQVYGRDSDTVQAGNCAAVNVRNWEAAAIARGNTATLPGYFVPQEWWLCKLRLLPHEKLSLKNGTRVRLHTGTSEAVAAVYMTDGEAMKAGDEGFVQVRTEDPVVAGPTDRFIMRTLSPAQTIGGGMIVEGFPRRLKRTALHLHELLVEWGDAVQTERTFAEYCVRVAEGHAATIAEVGARAKIAPARLKPLLGQLASDGRIVHMGGDTYVHAAILEMLTARLLTVLADYHKSVPDSPGLTSEALLEKAQLDKSLLEGIVERLKAEGRLAIRSQRLALPEHRETFRSDEAQLMERLEALLRGRPFSPPDAEELPGLLSAPADKVQRCVKLLIEHQRIARLPEGLLFHHEAIERAKSIVTDFLKKEGRLESVKFKYLLDTTRKYALPLLDHMDRIGVTRRIGNTRYLK
jgi:selenocysteine-specific elongation factor